MGILGGFISLGKKRHVPEGLCELVFFLMFSFGKMLQANNSSLLHLSLPLSLGRWCSCRTQQEPELRPVPTADGCLVLALVGCPAEPGQPGQGTPPHPHPSASPCCGSTRPPPTFLGQGTCEAKVTRFKSPEPAADCCSASFGQGICNLAQPRSPTPRGSACPSLLTLSHQPPSHPSTKGTGGTSEKVLMDLNFSATFFFPPKKPA